MPDAPPVTIDEDDSRFILGITRPTFQ